MDCRLGNAVLECLNSRFRLTVFTEKDLHGAVTAVEAEEVVMIGRIKPFSLCTVLLGSLCHFNRPVLYG